jgi:hypothetical protein
MSNLSCPLPRPATERIVLAHGGGGSLTNQLIEDIFLPAFSNPALSARHDGALFAAGGAKLAMTTDTYVVQPLIFPGGTIGDLAVNGTVNDLAMCGARPIALSAGFILEEGLAMETLRHVVNSMRDAALAANVPYRDRRHEGCGQGQRRRHLHQHNRHRRGHRTKSNRSRICSRRRRRSGQWRPWRPWNRDPVCARRPRVRRPSQQRHGLSMACCRSTSRSRHRDSLPARSDPRRPCRPR